MIDERVQTIWFVLSLTSIIFPLFYFYFLSFGCWALRSKRKERWTHKRMPNPLDLGQNKDSNLSCSHLPISFLPFSSSVLPLSVLVRARARSDPSYRTWFQSSPVESGRVQSRSRSPAPKAPKTEPVFLPPSPSHQVCGISFSFSLFLVRFIPTAAASDMVSERPRPVCDPPSVLVKLEIGKS